MEETKECCYKTKERSEKEYKDLINRLNRIEGQIRGIKGMIEKDAYCTDILTQVSAVSAALNSFNRVLLSNHIKTCVINDITCVMSLLICDSFVVPLLHPYPE